MTIDDWAPHLKGATNLLSISDLLQERKRLKERLAESEQELEVLVYTIYSDRRISEAKRIAVRHYPARQAMMRRAA